MVRGPSPRAWGFRARRLHMNVRRRSIPTRVGIPGWAPYARRTTSVHPHARGDSRVCLVQGVHQCGPSPRAWGFPLSPEAAALRRRSIPTRVGIPAPLACICATHSVHPHARGDSLYGANDQTTTDGPSPRAWGFRDRRDRARDSVRSIPTRVGIPGQAAEVIWHSPVHPHARGDSLIGASSPRAVAGPSPRAWGFHARPSTGA